MLVRCNSRGLWSCDKSGGTPRYLSGWRPRRRGLRTEVGEGRLIRLRVGIAGKWRLYGGQWFVRRFLHRRHMRLWWFARSWRYRNRRRIGKRTWGVLARDAHDAKRYPQAPVPSAMALCAGQTPPMLC